MKPLGLRMLVARNIRDMRKDADIDQKQFAEQMVALGFDKWVQQTVSDVERGRRGLLFEEGYPIALILGCRIEELHQVNVKQPLNCRGIRPLPVPIVTTWLHGQMVIQMQWDKEKGEPNGWRFSPEPGHEMQTLTALESIGLIPLVETIEDAHGNVIERYPPETAALRKERGINEPGEVQE